MIEKEYKYGDWLRRLLAYLIDFIIVTLVAFPLNYFNITGHKSFLWFLGVILISISYKPMFEFYYSKTIGKHFLGLNVKNVELQSISIAQAYIRNVFFILPSLLSIPFYYLAFRDPFLIEITGIKDFASAMSLKYPLQGILSSLIFVVLVVDSLFLFIDGKKKNRTLHDVFAKTLVLQS